MFKFQLGQHVRDVVNGFQGYITGRAQYVTGCTQYGVESPTEKHEGRNVHQWIDEIRLDTTGTEPLEFGDDAPASAPGGPVSHPPPR